MAEAPFRKLIDVSCDQACDTEVPMFYANDRISDLLEKLLHIRRDYFWVVDADHHYVGICRRADMLKSPKIKLILVDHHEVSQAVNGIDQADILEVLDHHRIGAISTMLPISFHVEVVGSCSTLIAERMRVEAMIPPPGIAGLLLSGLLSDTLIFKSPTSTPRDQTSANWLARIAFGASGSADADAKLQQYGADLLMAGADLTGRSVQDLITADYKEFESGKDTFGVAQIEVTSFSAVKDRLDEIRDALRAQRDARGLAFAALMITDIVQSNSLLAISNVPSAFAQMPFSKRAGGLYDMPGVVSRKKQLLPTLLGLMQG
jgi:manganese-dependent inorganic pyrophosphatase